MRTYYEAMETLPEMSETEPDFIRIDITDMTTIEQAETLELIKEHFSFMPHTLRLHSCNHDTGAPCVVELL